MLGLPVALAIEIAQEHGPAFGVAIEEGLVVQAFAHKCVDDTEHQGGVGAGQARHPIGAGLDGKIVAQRADQDERAAAPARGFHGAALDMLADRAAGHHGVLQRHAAERQHDVGILGNLLPGDVALGDVLVAGENLRQQHRGCARRVSVHRAHIAAHCDVEEAMHLALGMMEAARARPAVGAAEHGAGAARVADAAELVAEQIERFLPTDGDELIAAAAIVRPRSALEPGAADRRLRDARLMPQRAGEIADDAVRIGVARIGPDLEPGFALTRGKHAPMRGVGLEAVRQVEAGVGKANRIVHRLILVPRGTGPAAATSIPVAVYRSASRCRRDQGRRKRRTPARKYSLVTVRPRDQRRFLRQFILYFQYLAG
ncbi:hypothetical protein ACVIU4_002821 [Bradyrhizobium barranii subsp. barranii]